jgi:cytochrome c peroxidase
MRLYRTALMWLLSMAFAAGQTHAPDPPFGLPALLWPIDNPYTPAKAELGRILFFDGRLSLNNVVSCAFCHVPAHAFSGPAALSTGVDGQPTGRHTPTLINRGWGKSEFWDGRAVSVETQAIIPISNPHEMGMTADGVVAKLSQIKGYTPLFEAAFGDSQITFARAAQALATFERTIVSGNSAYDRYAAGDKSALSKDAKAGFDFFNGKGECSECHNGPNFSDEKFANLGIGMDAAYPDPGREAVTGKKSDFGKFKVPSLRDLASRGPYMHNGSLKTLADVLDFYSRAGLPNPHVDDRLLKFYMDADTKRNLLAFLDSLNGEGWQNIQAPAAFPR